MSIPATTLRKLASLGLSSEQMAGVLDILADGIEAEEARKAAQRERTRRARDKQRNVTATLQSRDGNCDDTHGRVIRVDDKTSNSEIEPRKISEAKRAFRLADDWTLPVEWRSDALKAGLPEQLIDLEAAKLRDWSRSSKNGAKLDWRAAWRNWCREAAARAPRAREGPPLAKPNPGRDTIDALLEQTSAVTSSETQGHPPYPHLVALPGR